MLDPAKPFCFCTYLIFPLNCAIITTTEFLRNGECTLKQKNNLYTTVKIAILISLIALSSYIYIPMPSVSVLSLQTVMINLTALMLSPSQSLVAVGTWLIMGAIGLPVFSGGGGLGKLFGVTGGFYWGFLVAAPLMSALKGKNISFKRYLAVTLLGVVTEHIFAVLVMCIHNGFDVLAAFSSISLPFLLGDILKCIASAILAVKLNSIKKLQDRHL